MPINPIQYKLDIRSLSLSINVAIQCGYEPSETINAGIQNKRGHTMWLEAIRNNNCGQTVRLQDLSKWGRRHVNIRKPSEGSGHRSMCLHQNRGG